MAIGTYISIITLNISGINAPNKKQSLAEWILKQDRCICCLKETQFIQTESEGIEKDIP